ncbi:Excision repair cross-complementation group 1 [Phytophthora boehmeriae]|uniref:DNA excision repair protein ERCC-1 n=1 Tax=Phytophthora boehmeriae TaxID=109152 RepID=A0A8T1WW43_9STRA|nr:Excision repair cross-complementation group 1 [Phytophthora boehmeriae]
MTIYVNKRQRGNPMLKDVRNVRLEYRDGLVPDFVIGDTSCCVLFLSTKYHLLHNNYLEERVQSVRKDDPTRYRTKIVLCLVDVDDNEFALREINRVALLSDFFLVLAWSSLEAARYLETLKAYENKPATVIKEKVEVEFLPEVNDALTTIPTVNKTDVFTLLSTFGTVSGAMKASMEELSLCPGVGATKVRELLGAFQEPFIKH